MPIVELRSKSTTAFKDGRAHEFRDREAIAFYGRTPLVSSTADAELSFIQPMTGTAIIVCDVESSELTMGSADQLTGTSYITTDSSAQLEISGVVESLSGTVSISSNVDSTALTIGIIEQLSGTTDITTDSSAQLDILGSISLSGATDITTDSTGTLTFGYPETLSGTASIESSDTTAELYTTTSMSGTASIESSDSSAVLTMVTYLTGTVDITTDSTATIFSGITETLSGTSNITTDSTANIDLLGTTEVLSGSADITTDTTAEISFLGNPESLSGSSDITTDASASISFGSLISLDGTCVITTSSLKFGMFPTILDIGHIEDLTGTAYIWENDAVAELTIGINTELSGKAEIIIDSTSTAELITPRVLTATASITTNTTADSFHFEPILYLDTSGAVITTFVSDASCTIGIPEILSSNVGITTEVDGTLTGGIGEELSGTAEIGTDSSAVLSFPGVAKSLDSTAHITTDVTGDLLLGNIESISGSSIITTDTYATLQGLLVGTAEITTDASATIDIIISLSRDKTQHFTLIESNVTNAPLNFDYSGTASIGTDSSATLSSMEWLSGTADCTSVVTVNPGLDVGYLKGTAEIESSTFATTLSFGTAEKLRGTAAIVSSTDGQVIIDVVDLSGSVSIESDASSIISIERDLRGSVSIESNITADLTHGVAWPLDSSAIITTTVNGDLSLGIITSLSGTSAITTDTTSSITFGLDVPLSSTSSITTNCDGFLAYGKWEFLSGDTHIQSNVTSEHLILNLQELDSSASIVSYIDSTTELVLGRELSGSISIQSDVATVDTTSDFIIGTIENLSGTSYIWSDDSTALLSIGYVSEPLSGTAAITSDATASIFFGAPIPLSGTADCTSIVSFADLQIPGVVENLSGTIPITTDTSADLTIGIIENLSGTANIDSTTNANLTVSMTASVSIVSDTTAVLSLGAIEELSGTCVIDSTTSGDLLLGNIEDLSGSSEIVSDANATLGVFGAIEGLSHTIMVTGYGFASEFVDTDDVSWFRGTTGDFITTDATAELTLGFTASLSGTAAITSDATCVFDISFGVAEELSGTAAITSDAYVDLESPKPLSGSVDCTSVVSFALMDVDVPGKYIRRTTIDLQYWYNKFLIESDLNKYNIPHPATVDEEILEQKSFIEMLLNEAYSENSYRYRYRRITDRASWPQSVLQRMMIQPTLAEYFVADSDDANICEINLYALQSDDLRLLDRLLEYRLYCNNDGTAVVITDIVYDDLITNLSKMIYIYLDLKLNDSYSRYDETAGHDSYLLSGSADLLECMYETYLVENVFDHIVEKGT